MLEEDVGQRQKLMPHAADLFRLEALHLVLQRLQHVDPRPGTKRLRDDAAGTRVDGGVFAAEGHLHRDFRVDPVEGLVGGAVGFDPDGSVFGSDSSYFRIANENIVFALGVKLIVLILGALGIASMWLAVFADVGVSFIAIINATRVMRNN